MNKQLLTSYWQGKLSQKVLEAFQTVPREEFVTAELRSRAYEDVPLPILRGKTISQPSTVLIMTEALEVQPGQKVLEVGSGSGYQAALIAKIANPGMVITTEVVPELVVFAQNNLRRTGIANVRVLEHDGSQGCDDEAPYDRIIMTAATPTLPLHLLSQLKMDGILIAPVGDLSAQQMVKLIRRQNRVEQQSLGEFVFSPLIGKFGFDEEKVI